MLFLNCRRSFYLLNFPPVDVAVVLSQRGGNPGQPVTLDLTISLAADSSSLTIEGDHPSILMPTEVASTSKPLLPLQLAEISSAEGALRDAGRVMKTMNLHDTWRNACTKIEWVMNVVSPITEVRILSIVASFN